MWRFFFPKELNTAGRVSLSIGFANLAFSLMVVLFAMIDASSSSRRASEDALELMIINLAVFGPLFLVGVVFASFAKEQRGRCLLINLFYIAGWIMIGVIDSMS